MINGFEMMASLCEAGAEMARSSMKLGELAIASNTVITERVGMMSAAARDPMRGDYAELGRIVPEKVVAFSQAGSSVIEDVGRLQMEWARQMTDAGLFWFGGVPTAASAQRLADRGAARMARMTRRAMGISGRALDPVHKRATGNARRLKRG